MNAWEDGFECETPNSDANRIFLSIRQMLLYMWREGARSIIYDTEFDCWRCTDSEWIDGRNAYSEWKEKQNA